MQDVILSAKRIRFEILMLLTCFVLAELLNVYSIVTYGTSWTEIFSKIGFVLVVMAVFYVIHWIIRFIIFVCLFIVQKTAPRR